jgi:hypothetical protein
MNITEMVKRKTLDKAELGKYCTGEWQAKAGNESR